MRVVEGVEVLPTLTELAGVSPLGPLDGDSRAPEVRGERLESPETGTFTETFYAAEHRVRLTTPEWTFIRTEGRNGRGLTRELYAANDPMQAKDVSAKQRGLIKRMDAQVEAWETPLEAQQVTWEAGERTEEIDAQLRELGYID